MADDINISYSFQTGPEVATALTYCSSFKTLQAGNLRPWR